VGIKTCFGVAAVAVMALSSSANASIITFTDRAAWESAVHGLFSEETFSTASTNGFTIDQIGGGHSSGIAGGVFHDRVVLDDSYTTYNFNAAIYAFGASWDLTPGGAGQGLQLFAGSEAVSTQISNNYAGGFFGVVSTNAFSSFSVHSGSFSGSAETHDVDNLVFAAAVPEPESYAMLLAGLGLMGAIVRRRKSKQA
jgi:hypothetical protein